MSDELELNSIERFSKKSKRLILEELSSCEVPAGCGGVVLRWFSPDQGLSVGVRIHHYGGEIAFYCNGDSMPKGCANIPFGPGLLAIQIGPRDHVFDWLCIASNHTSPSQRSGDNQNITELSGSLDGSWKFTTTDPGEGWMNNDFDDATWTSLKTSTIPIGTLPKEKQWRFKYLANGEYTIFALPQDGAWIRKRFDLSKYAPE